MTPTKCPRCGAYDCRLRAFDRPDGRSQLYRECVAKRDGLSPTPAIEYGSDQYRSLTRKD